MEVKEVTFITKKNPKGVKSSIKLSDGSVIHLNSNSEIIYPNEFSDSLRTISLKGEAFFDVSKESRPFKVNVDNTIVEVLGTEFNINQSKGEELAVALVSGKVKVNDTHGNQVILDPSEMLVIKNDGNFYKSTFDSLQVVGWKDKNLIFKRDDFYTVKEKLENWYGIEITVKGKIGSKWAYTGEYHDETLKNVLEGIRQTSNIHYKLKGKKVEITL
ncbi:FecR family protein [Algoriphagus halophilus]|uniref:FecR family protein n=1 Tax=Algoriphagus halophilus TaxID=226505 RepID=UPI00358F3E18